MFPLTFLNDFGNYAVRACGGAQGWGFRVSVSGLLYDGLRFGGSGAAQGEFQGERPHHYYRGASLIRNRPPLGPYSRPLPRALWCSWGGGHFL